jgi:hypothetical protein
VISSIATASKKHRQPLAQAVDGRATLRREGSRGLNATRGGRARIEARWRRRAGQGIDERATSRAARRRAQDAQRSSSRRSQLAAGRDAPAAALPIRLPGRLPWPSDGGLVRFGAGGRGAPASPQRIELSLPEGRAVHAVHEGVAFADAFSGGNF